MTVDVWPLTKEQRRALAVSGIACGTPEGYRLHRHQHTDPCPPCAWAWDASPGCTPVPRPVCGTNEGWTAHRKRLEWPCGRCAEAREVHERALCGSLAGWNIHRRNGSVICDRCHDYVRDYNAERAAGTRLPFQRLPVEARAIDPATRTGRLRRALLTGAVLVCTREPWAGRSVSYAPRSRFDKYPWRIVSDPAHYVMAADLRAVRPEEKEDAA